MQYSPTIPIPTPPTAELRPNPILFDSGRERRMDHWLEVNRLAEKEEVELRCYLKGYLLEDS